eukprot:CAMPEP_0169089806 /NCGR_PEP_ID=MMETSP1015-20121227/15485_1 /TAXON_ID=342587 /ORGANISM="Karlodinium micrum, Strain CCMP2283" /LENGTH=58 /DNA_ID=CAMNT_0009150175 /DNA_START=317 /DNA_END=493 /DNA_ORIENTATION=-
MLREDCCTVASVHAVGGLVLLVVNGPMRTLLGGTLALALALALALVLTLVLLPMKLVL